MLGLWADLKPGRGGRVGREQCFCPAIDLDDEVAPQAALPPPGYLPPPPKSQVPGGSSVLEQSSCL